MKKIFIVDDHPALRQGLESIIEEQDGLTVCGSAGSAEEALSLVESSNPDLVMTDLSLPGRNGVELIKDLAELRPGLPVLVISMHDELVYSERILRAGGKGFLKKEASTEVLIEAVFKVLAGGVSVSKEVANHLLGSMASGTRGDAQFPLQRLTDRELEVFELVGCGKGNRDIAVRLSVSPRTIEAHKAHIREKLGLADANELMRYAVRWTESGEIE